MIVSALCANVHSFACSFVIVRLFMNMFARSNTRAVILSACSFSRWHLANSCFQPMQYLYNSFSLSLSREKHKQYKVV